MFYKKKVHVPWIKDLIVYPNMSTLCKYEWITKNTFQFERRIWLIVKSLYLKEKNVRKWWEFDKYSNWYIRLTDVVLAEEWFSALKRKKNARKKSNELNTGDTWWSIVSTKQEHTGKGPWGSQQIAYY